MIFEKNPFTTAVSIPKSFHLTPYSPTFEIHQPTQIRYKSQISFFCEPSFMYRFGFKIGEQNGGKPRNQHQTPAWNILHGIPDKALQV